MSHHTPRLSCVGAIGCVAVCFLLASLPSDVAADECLGEWTFSLASDEVAKIRACVYSSGGSGYYEIENLTGQTVKLCWKITYNDNSSNSGCRTMGAYEESSGSCYSCAPRNSGVADIDITRFDIM